LMPMMEEETTTDAMERKGQIINFEGGEGFGSQHCSSKVVCCKMQPLRNVLPKIRAVLLSLCDFIIL
jgi:hypothetical protein